MFIIDGLSSMVIDFVFICVNVIWRHWMLNPNYTVSTGFECIENLKWRMYWVCTCIRIFCVLPTLSRCDRLWSSSAIFSRSHKLGPLRFATIPTSRDLESNYTVIIMYWYLTFMITAQRSKRTNSDSLYCHVCMFHLQNCWCRHHDDVSMTYACLMITHDWLAHYYYYYYSCIWLISPPTTTTTCYTHVTCSYCGLYCCCVTA